MRYAVRRCPEDREQDWTKSEIEAIIQHGLHKSALAENSIAQIHRESKEKEEQGFVKIVS